MSHLPQNTNTNVFYSFYSIKSITGNNLTTIINNNDYIMITNTIIYLINFDIPINITEP